LKGGSTFRRHGPNAQAHFVAVVSWVGISFGLWVIAWIIASAIPVFSSLLSLIVFVAYLPSFILAVHS
jgi:hypothetical protein